MLNLLFVAALLCLLPSVIAVSVVPLQLSPSFWQLNKEDPCFWGDGALSLHNGRVSVSVGRKSSVLVFSGGKMQAPLSNLHTTFELTEPDSYIFIITEKDEVYSTIDNRNDYIIRLAHHTLYGEGIDTQICDEQSFFDSAILRTTPPNPVREVNDLEEFISTEDREILDLDFDSALASEDTGLNDNDFETQNNLVDLFYADITQSTTNMETNSIFKETEKPTESIILSNDIFNTKLQFRPSENYVYGEQYKSPKDEEPMIYISKGLVICSQFVSSLTGENRQTKNKNWEPFTGEHRIPDGTKLLIVNEGNFVKYYKNITLGSKVWYLRRDEKVFHPCIVHFFGINKYPKPTLKCVSHEPQLVPKVSWDDIFPIESTDLINDLGEFVIRSEDIYWGEILKENETGKLTLEERKEQYCWNNNASPFLIHSKPHDDKWKIINSINGELRNVDPGDLVKMKENDEIRIPRETKITDDRQSRFIVLESEIYFHWKDRKVLIQGRVESIYDQKVTINRINGKTFRNVKWDNVYQIESYGLIKHLAPLWTPETSTAILPTRKYNRKENGMRKERRINDVAGVNNLENNNDIIMEDESFLVGEQLSHKGKVHPPFIFLSVVKNGKHCYTVDTEKGKVCCRQYNKFSRLPAEYQISEETKISEDGKFKFILPKSGVLYRNSDGTYYPCKVTKLPFQSPLGIRCDTLGVVYPSWDEVVPIEAFPTLSKPLRIHGFADAETVTLDMLREKINGIPSFYQKK